MTDLIRKSDALDAVKKARVAYQKSTDDTPYDFFLRDAIAALPAVAVGVNKDSQRDFKVIE